MAVFYRMKYTTIYKYANHVTFGTHCAVFVPQRGARARLLSWAVHGWRIGVSQCQSI
jgi:Bacterial transglutaminase-like N-terminal region